MNKSKSGAGVNPYRDVSRSVWFAEKQYAANLVIGAALRQYAAEHPGGLAHFRTSMAWAKLIERQMKPGQQLPDQFRSTLVGFLEAGDNHIGSANPWSITCRFVPGPRRDLGGLRTDPRIVEAINSLGAHREYSIGRVRSREEDCRHSAAELKKVRAAAAERDTAYDFGYPDFTTEDVSDLTSNPH
jgi:hypothetical protein